MAGESPITPEAVAALVRFLPIFEAPGFTAGTWRGGQADENGVIQMPWLELGPEASAFIGEIGRHGWIVVFDWPAWHLEAERLVEAGGIEQADLDDLRRLLTTLVRQDRFVEGSLGDAMESGIVTRILRRLQALADEVEKRESD